VSQMEERTFDPKRLAECRSMRQLSQRALAIKAGVSQALIAELERGKHPPSPTSAGRIAAALDIPVAELFIESNAGGKNH
jgi:transcriptional regulator with XRE-family HTH domain